MAKFDAPSEFPFPLFGAIKLEVDYTTSGLIDKLDLDKQQLKVLVANMKCMHTAEGLLYYEGESVKYLNYSGVLIHT